MRRAPDGTTRSHRRTPFSGRVPIASRQLTASSTSVVGAGGAVASFKDEEVESNFCGAEGACSMPFPKKGGGSCTLRSCGYSCMGVVCICVQDPACKIVFTYTTGTILRRVAPAHIPKNGKRYHIHTFGCQVRAATLPACFCTCAFVHVRQLLPCCEQSPCAAEPSITNFTFLTPCLVTPCLFSAAPDSSPASSSWALLEPSISQPRFFTPCTSPRADEQRRLGAHGRLLGGGRVRVRSGPITGRRPGLQHVLHP